MISPNQPAVDNQPAVAAPWYPENLPRRFSSLQAEIRPETVHSIHENCSLGLHVSMLVRLSNGTDCVFTERYPALSFPANGQSACSLNEVAARGGPKFTAHEVTLEINGVSDMQQIHAIRRLRGEFPEMSAVEMNKTDVVITLSSAHELSPRRIMRLTKLAPVLLHRKLVIRPSLHSFPLNGELSEADRGIINHFSSLAWRDHPTKSHRKGGGPAPGKAKNQHVQTILIAADSLSAHIMQEGPISGTPRTVRHAVPNSDVTFSVTNLRGGHLAWRDTARSGLLKLTVAPESIQVHKAGHDLWITALLTPGAVKSGGRHIIPRLVGAPLELRTSLIPSDSEIIRLAFDIVPSEFGLRGLVESDDRKRVLLHFDRAPSQEEIAPVRSYLEKATGKRVYCASTRFTATPPENPITKRIIAQIPSGVVLKHIYQCQVTGDVLLSTVRQIPQPVLKRMSESLSVHVSQTQDFVNVPEIIRKPAAIMSSAPPIRPNLTPGIENPIGEVTALGGAGGIGGSTFLVGDQILFDCGAWPESPGKFVDLDGTPWADIRVAIETHSHNDHVGNSAPLWKKLKDRNPEYPTQFIMHHATALSMYPVLCEQQGHQANLITPEDISHLYAQVRLMPLHYPVALSPSVTLTLYPAGHHVGSTMALLEYKGPQGTRRVLYSGDLNSRDGDFGEGRLYPPAARVPDLDALIIEGTNGITPMPSREEQEHTLLEEIIRTVKDRGTVILPVLASGRAQEVLTILRRNIHRFKELGVPIFVDGRSIYSYNDIFSYLGRVHPEIFRVQNRDLPGWRGLTDGVFQQVPATGNLRFKEPGVPKIVVVSGGMGFGPSSDYIRGLAPDKRSKVIFTCYQVQKSYGTRILSHVQNPEADPRLKDFKAQAVSCRLSGHNSGKATLEVIKESLKPGGTVVLVHGSPENLKALHAAITAQGHAGLVVIAETGKTIQLW